MHPEFVKFLQKISAAAAQSYETVLQTWKQYASDCDCSDQSPVSQEFLNWHYPSLRNAIPMPFAD